MKTFDKEAILPLGRQVIAIEANAVHALQSRIDDTFADACQLCLDCLGRIVVTGMGKSGHIGSKIAATLASTGTPSFFVHPAEASHGDLGMITADDLVLAVSYSGETDEIVTILPLVKRMGARLVSMTGNPKSTLAKAADVHLDVSVSEEARPLNLAPTASTTATLAMVALAFSVFISRQAGRTARELERKIDEIRALLEFVATAGQGAASGRGCLLCNTAVEFGPEDPSGAGFVNRYFKRLSAAFESALTNALSKGDLHQSVDPRREAGFLTSSVLGMFVMLRAKAPTGLIKGAAQSAIDYLDTLQAEPAK